MTDQHITAAELARRLNVSRSAVTKAVKDGRITPDNAGRFDPEEAERQWRANTRPNMKAAPSAGGTVKATDYREARAKKERHAANIMELREARIRDEYANTADTLETLANQLFIWRAFFDILPEYINQALQGKTEFAEMETAIEQEINRLMADDIAALLSKAVYDRDALESPPSPLERAILEFQYKDLRQKLGKVYHDAFAEIVNPITATLKAGLPMWNFQPVGE